MKICLSLKKYNKDSVDEVASAHSLAFSTDGMQLYAGLTNEIRIFETMIPGNVSSTIKLGKGYHSGIISTLAVNDDVIVAGSFSKEIGVYDSRSHNQISFVEKAHSGGVTGVSFLDDQNLISAGRKCPEIKVEFIMLSLFYSFLVLGYA